MPTRTLLYLSRSDIDELDVSMPEVIAATEQALREKSSGRTVMPAKHWLAPSEERFYSAMSSVAPSIDSAACKWQSGSSRNADLGLPYVTGLLILNDNQTGMPVAVMDSTWITAKRTAAATAVTAKYLAKPDARTVGIVGTGVQARTHVEALRCVSPGLEYVRAYDINLKALHDFAEEVSRSYSILVEACEEPREVFAGSDIVMTGGAIHPNAQRHVQADWLEPGMLAVAIDYDCYWHADSLAAADRLFTDDISQLHHLKEYGYFHGISAVDAEIGEVVAGRAARRQGEEVLVAFNLGVAVEDVFTAVLLAEHATQRGIGIRLPM